MAERNPAIVDLVRKRIDEQPDITPTALLPEAAAIDPSVSEMSARQFNGLYVLSAKRERKGADPAASRKTPKRRKKSVRKQRGASASQVQQRGQKAQAQTDPGSQRDQIRSIFLEFATDLSKATTQVETIQVIQSLDSHVDRLTEIMQPSR